MQLFADTNVLSLNGSSNSRSYSVPGNSSTGTYQYGLTNSPTWNVNQGSYTNNNTTAPDGSTTAGTYTLSTTSWDLYQTIAVTSGTVYRVGVWVRLGTATNFCLVVNNTQNWNTVGGKAFTSSDGLSTSKWTHVSFTFTGPSTGNINLHIGAHSESITQQTAGTVFVWNWEVTTGNSTWVANIDDEVRLPSTSIFTSRGLLGLGTTSPSARIHISAANGDSVGTYYSQLRIDGTGTYPDNIAGISLNPNAAIQSHIRFLENGSVKAQIRFNAGNSSDNKLKVYSWTTNSDFFTWDCSNGNVGIGTDSPGQPLDILRSTNGPAVINVRNPNTGTLAHAGLYIGSDASTNVGGIITFNSTATGYGFPYNPNGTYIYSNRTGGIAINSEAAGPLYLATSNTSRFYITSGGNIGIGTTSPSLHSGGNGLVVRGSARGIIELWDATSGKSVFQNVGGDTYIGQLDKGTGAGTTYLLVNGNGSSADIAMTLLSNSNIGVGVNSPTAKFQVFKDGGNGSGGLTDFGIVTTSTSSSGTFQATIGAMNTQLGGYANLNLGDSDGVSGTRYFWHISKRLTSATELGAGSRNLSYYWYDGTNFSIKFAFGTNGSFYASSDVVAYASSDIRLKENIVKIDSALDKISQLNGYSFTWNDKQTTYAPGKKDLGVIAQEVQNIFPEIVKDRENGTKGVMYDKLVPVLIEAIKELANENESLKERLKSLENSIYK